MAGSHFFAAFGQNQYFKGNSIQCALYVKIKIRLFEEATHLTQPEERSEYAIVLLGVSQEYCTRAQLCATKHDSFYF